MLRSSGSVARSVSIGRQTVYSALSQDSRGLDRVSQPFFVASVVYSAIMDHDVSVSWENISNLGGKGLFSAQPQMKSLFQCITEGFR